MSLGTKDVEISRVSGLPTWGVSITARLDSGAARSSIDQGFLKLLKLKREGEVTVRNANGREIRDTVVVLVDDGESLIELEVSLADRKRLSYPMILGRDYLEEE
jgi:hypothetical protein